MAEKKKKNKKSYLRDFEELSDGSYVYTGKTWRADPAVRRLLLIKLWALCAAMLIAVLLPGFVTTAGLLNTFYVIIPYVLWLISDFYLAYTLGNMTFGGNPLRDYVYERSVGRFALHVMAPFVCAAATAAALAVFLLRGGKGEGAGLCLLCCAVQLAASYLARRSHISEIWTEEKKPKDDKMR